MTSAQHAVLHVFCGTAAEYLKLAPVLRVLDNRGITYRLIDTGQHHRSAAVVRQQLGVRDPDVQLGANREVDSVLAAVRWLRALGVLMFSARRRDSVFASHRGVCLVHGDTLSTAFAAIVARRHGLAIGHVEAGLRSRALFHPFPEELVRVIVMRSAAFLFAPDATAVRNLEAMRLRGRIVPLSANTMLESLRLALPDETQITGDGPVVITLHRVENLHRRRRRAEFVALAKRIRATHDVLFVLHPATRAKLSASGELAELQQANVTLVDVLDHTAFVRALTTAPFVVTDGGSIQEECAALGVPCLLWRKRTERPDGIGTNVVVSRHNPRRVQRFLQQYASLRQDQSALDAHPSDQIVDVVEATMCTFHAGGSRP